MTDHDNQAASQHTTHVEGAVPPRIAEESQDVASPSETDASASETGLPPGDDAAGADPDVSSVAVAPSEASSPGAAADVVVADSAAAHGSETDESAEDIGVSAPPPDDAADGESESSAGPVADGEEASDAPPTNPAFKWYVVHTYSGYENRARKSLEERIRQFGQQDSFGELLIPTENVVELSKGGQKKTTKRKFFPGYMLVQMELNDETWHLVKSTPKITGFVGSATQPPSVPEAEVRRLTQQIDEGTLKPKPRVQFEEGENVRVVDGPFSNFNGVVDAVNPDKARVRVLVSIFGRSTPVELEFIQVEKA